MHWLNRMDDVKASLKCRKKILYIRISWISLFYKRGLDDMLLMLDHDDIAISNP